MTDIALPDGYTIDAPPPVALPEGYVVEQPPTGAAAVGANAATGLMSGVGNLIGFPHSMADLAQSLKQHLGIPQQGLLGLDVASRVQQHTYSPTDINTPIYNAANTAFGTSAFPYAPTTAWGSIGQHLMGNVLPAAVGGLSTLPAREAVGAGATLASDLYGYARPEDFWGRLGAGLAGGIAGAGAARLGAGIGNVASRVAAPESTAARVAAQNLVDVSGSPNLLGDIQNAPQWTVGARPTLGNLTANPGIRNLEYNDQAAAARAGDTVYQENARLTNAAQRAAVAGVTPDASATINNLINDRDAAVNAIPQGVSAQDAGAQLRTALQQSLDQRSAARAAGGSAFDVLETHPAQINLRPVMDYATERAAQNAGEVGQAYQRALGQFRSATGITLDTAPFANSVLKGLGDLANSYDRGSAAARAVIDVKSRLENQLSSQVPEIAQARATWAQNSRPLDVFEAKPFGSVLATDRFGRAYAMPNDAVAAAFLRGNGSADALDALHRAVGDPVAATRGLQDYIAGQVRQNALRADGSIDPVALQRVTQPYQRALLRFPDLANKFRDASSAQRALDQQMAYQRIYDTFRNGLGTMEQDAAGNPMYSAAQFDRAIQAHQGDLVSAYGQQGADTINRVNDELTNIAQTAYAKVKGQSGTPQALGAPGAFAGHLGKMAGSLLGFLAEHSLGHSGGFVGTYVGGQVGEAMQHVLGGNLGPRIEAIRRQALTDPAYAEALLSKYNPTLPAPAMQRRLEYVISRTPFLAPTPSPLPNAQP